MGRWVYGTVRVGVYRTIPACGNYRTGDLGVRTLWDQQVDLRPNTLSDQTIEP